MAADQSRCRSGSRTETDSLGSVEIPDSAYWGVHTKRALENFQISETPISRYPQLVVALACVKQAAALANGQIGAIAPHKAAAIAAACRDIRDGLHHEQFCVDVIQGGAGTSTNMNANEVIANLALEKLGYSRGEYRYLHPIDDVNRCQSTNDTYPTSLKLALVFSVQELVQELELLSAAFTGKGLEFAHVVKVGRTQLQDAVPMTLGQEFTAFGATIAEDCARLVETLPLLAECSLGATAIGTGITADTGYAALALGHLQTITGLPMTPAANLMEASWDTGVFMQVSGAMKRSAIKLSKICSDLRLLSSGPQAGFGEINLPPRQAGSSIMPGKVNPVIPEVVNQIAFAIAGADVTVTMAADNGQLQLNAFEPVIAHSLLQGISWLRRGSKALRRYCVEGITANDEFLAQRAAESVGMVTALIPSIGYAAAANIAREALATNSRVIDLIAANGLLDPVRAAELMSPGSLSAAGID
ncbi:aspartate ammonia-lyase [Pseudarthrobacter sp. P1]|uniref:aspartate ammonia-lyase n=1 Tax=Pseudarthrobacter sp. P1 TaxID=3418418 RepID=UPI003CED83C2